MNEKLYSLIRRVDLKSLVEKDFDLRYYKGYAKGIIHDSLVITDDNLFYWNSLGINGNALDWLIEVKGLPFKEAISKLYEAANPEYKPGELPIERNIYPKLLDLFFEFGKNHRHYWYEKGYSDATIDRFKLGYTGRCYVIPILFGGELYNFQCKIPANGQSPKKIWSWASGMGLLPFNFDCIEDNSTIFIIESPGDAINVSQLGLPAVSQNGGSNNWNSEFNKYLIGVREIIICYDADKPGFLGSLRLAEKFKDRAKILMWPDSVDLTYGVGDLLKDRNLSKTSFLDYLSDKVISPNNLSFSDRQSISNRYTEKQQSNYKTIEIVSEASFV